MDGHQHGVPVAAQLLQRAHHLHVFTGGQGVVGTTGGCRLTDGRRYPCVTAACKPPTQLRSKRALEEQVHTFSALKASRPLVGSSANTSMGLRAGQVGSAWGPAANVAMQGLCARAWR